MNKSKIIDKETLIDLYINKRKTTFEISEMFGVCRQTVSNWLEKYDIDKNPKQRKFEIIKATPLTKEQKEMIVGTMLGDGNISNKSKSSKSYSLMIEHGEKQLELVMWKKSILGNLVNVIHKRIRKSGYKPNSISYCFTSLGHQELKFFYEYFYQNNKKVIPNDIANYLSPLAMAVWFSDDGYTAKKGNHCKICTNDFTTKENEILRDAIKTNFNINCKVAFTKNKQNNKVYPYLSFNMRNMQLLLELIKPYMIECMKYKVLENSCSSTTTCQTLENNNSNDDIV